MAVNYTTQPLNPNTQLPLLGHHQHQISPADSASNSPHNASPTSPRSNPQQFHIPGQVRGLRPLKSPLYVPAALRPTERPYRSTPSTPPKSQQGSLENLVKAGHTNVDSATPADLEETDHGGFVDEDLGPVTGDPNRDHWKADKQSFSCDSPQCRTNFNIFRRRHHCRHCGHIFCSDHSRFTIPLNQDARFHQDAPQFRACDTCHRHYLRWDAARVTFKQRQKEDEERREAATAGEVGEGDEQGEAALGGKQKAVPKGIPTGTPTMPPGSMPREWSTF